MRAHYRRLFRFDAWANRLLLEAIEREPAAPPRALQLLAHLIGAQWLWLQRIGVGGAEMAVWPELDRARCREELAALESVWGDFLDTLDDEKLERKIEYVNSRGERWASRVEDVLSHVIIHGGHHRGQALTTFRAAGLTPPYVDYIEATRRGWID